MMNIVIYITIHMLCWAIYIISFTLRLVILSYTACYYPSVIKSIVDIWKTGSEVKISNILISLWEAMRVHGFYHKRFRNKQMEKALAFYR